MGFFSLPSLFLEVLLLVGLMIRMLRFRLHRQYRWFFIYLVKSLSLILLAGVINVHSRTYCVVYWSTRPVDLALCIAMTKEVVNGIHDANPGLRWLARDLLWALVGVSTIIGFASIYSFELASVKCSHLECEYVKFLRFEYFTLTGLVVFLILANIQLRRMARILWNETVYSAMLILDFSLEVVAPLLLFAWSRKHVAEINMAFRLGNLLWASIGLLLFREVSPQQSFGTVSLEEYLKGLGSYREALYGAQSASAAVPQPLSKRLLPNG
jgi:hypothetical protein